MGADDISRMLRYTCCRDLGGWREASSSFYRVSLTGPILAFCSLALDDFANGSRLGVCANHNFQLLAITYMVEPKDPVFCYFVRRSTLDTGVRNSSGGVPSTRTASAKGWRTFYSILTCAGHAQRASRCAAWAISAALDTGEEGAWRDARCKQ